jgi:hypothetical protein
LLIRIALRWIFVREQAASPSLFWIDVTRSFEKAIGRKFASVKRKISSLEEQWRAKFAARDAHSGLQGNNNTELARVMRAWIAFRDEEERVKREKEEDGKALDVRRERLHELETERLGLADVCRYETMVVGEEEETEPQGVNTGDRPNPISFENAVDGEPQQTRPGDSLYRDLQLADSNDEPKRSDPVAPIAELLRKRQREEREEADIRREEQVLLNKRLAMMEEQVQILSKLMCKEKSQPVSPPRRANAVLNERTEVSTRLEADAGAADESNRSGTVVEITEVSTDVPMPDISTNTASGSETAAVGTSGSKDSPIGIMDSANATAESETTAKGASGSKDAPIGIAEHSPNVSVNGSADVLDETPAESGNDIPGNAAEAQIDVNDSPETIDAPTAAGDEAVPDAVQATESANEEPTATPISEED